MNLVKRIFVKRPPALPLVRRREVDPDDDSRLLHAHLSHRRRQFAKRRKRILKTEKDDNSIFLLLTKDFIFLPFWSRVCKQNSIDEIY